MLYEVITTDPGAGLERMHLGDYGRTAKGGGQVRGKFLQEPQLLIIEQIVNVAHKTVASKIMHRCNRSKFSKVVFRGEEAKSIASYSPSIV